MKLKNLTIAIAMASLGVASFAAQAETGTSFYGSVRAGIEYFDNGTDDTTTIRNFNSRFGFKGETELGNGLTGFGHYEFGVSLDGSDGSAAVNMRKGYVGVKGGFGRFRIGQDYHTFYNTVLAPADQGWWDTLAGATKVTNGGRTGEAMTFDSKFGMFGVGATSYMNDDQMGDGYEFGATFGAGPATVGLGIRDTDSEDSTYGASVGGKAGSVAYGLSYVDRKDVGNSVDLHLGLGDAYLSYGQASLDSGTDPNGITLGYTYKMGKQTSSWFELSKQDADVKGKDATTAFRAALKYDF